ncbi:MAG: hypothetical protein ACJ79R_24605 [Anaeromyxobacteraceae bacterium]
MSPAWAQEFTGEQATKAVLAYVDARVQKDGSFRYKDQRADAVLELVPDGVRVVRQIHPYGHFVCTNFHAKGLPGKPYDLDFWLKPAGEALQVVDVRIHKAPKREGEAWKLVTREPLLWWWIPATEHPGETEEKRGWQVESALHEYIARKVKDGVLAVKDDKTGRDLALEFVEIHKPLRKVEGKGYFACSDFREPGSRDKFYDLDFWLVDKGGKLEVTEVRVHKEPKMEDGRWVQVPRYSFEGGEVKDVP